MVLNQNSNKFNKFKQTTKQGKNSCNAELTEKDDFDIMIFISICKCISIFFFLTDYRYPIIYK